MLKIKKKLTEMKNAFDGFISRLDKTEVRMFEIEDIVITGKMKNRIKAKKKQNIQGLRDNCKIYNIHKWEYQKKNKLRKEQRKYLKQ